MSDANRVTSACLSSRSSTNRATPPSWQERSDTDCVTTADRVGLGNFSLWRGMKVLVVCVLFLIQLTDTAELLGVCVLFWKQLTDVAEALVVCVLFWKQLKE